LNKLKIPRRNVQNSSVKIIVNITLIGSKILVAFTIVAYLRDGYFPKELKVTKVIPLFKNKGSFSDISNIAPFLCYQYFQKFSKAYLFIKKLLIFSLLRRFSTIACMVSEKNIPQSMSCLD
jgi:hypothetical protein